MKNSAFLLVFLFLGLTGFTQEKLTSEEKQQNIASLAKLMDSIYVFPEKAKEASTLVQQQQANGAYDKIETPYHFAEAVTKDLRSVTHDLHINIHYDPAGIAKKKRQEKGEEAGMTQAERLAMENYGFEEVKILPGNVGYLDLRFFYSPKEAAETAIATMNFLSNTDAIIFDLRRNGGGDPEMIQLLQSYLFEQEPVHLNNFYFRPTDEHTQTWTLPYVPGKRNPNAHVYVLTSNRTFSAGEEFTYDLKNLERATIVGENTGGGANPGRTYNMSDQFSIFIPSGRAI
ncbi:MAG: S41 family peptidase, partial [Salinimicrobium sp.]